MEKNNKNIELILHRTIAPYAGIPIVIFLITLLWIPYMIKNNDWSPLASVAIMVALCLLIISMGSSYQIWYSNNTIFRKAAGFQKIITSIKLEDIKNIKEEVSDLNTLLKLNRPLRRITIYGKTSDGSSSIDVSLKHFKLEDIHKLMKLIHEHRPDISIPKNYLI